MLSWAVLNKIQLFFFILASFLVKKIMRLNFELRKNCTFFFSVNHAVSPLFFQPSFRKQVFRTTEPGLSQETLICSCLLTRLIQCH